jgi:hypothetical protein
VSLYGTWGFKSPSYTKKSSQEGLSFFLVSSSRSASCCGTDVLVSVGRG